MDDLTLIGRVKLELQQLQDSYVAYAASKGLIAKPSKIIPPSSEGVTTLGILLHGRDLTFGLSKDKLLKLSAETQQLLDAKSCTGMHMSRLVGKWTWPVLVCRPALSVFSAVYRFIQAAGCRVFEIWGSVKRELQVMMGLAPLLFASLASEWLPSVVATDASATGCGVVYTADESEDSLDLLSAQCVGDPEHKSDELELGLAARQWKTAVA